MSYLRILLQEEVVADVFDDAAIDEKCMPVYIYIILATLRLRNSEIECAYLSELKEAI